MPKDDDTANYLDSTPEEMDERWSAASIFLSGLIVNTKEKGSKEHEEALRNTVLAMTLIPKTFWAKC